MFIAEASAGISTSRAYRCRVPVKAMVHFGIVSSAVRPFFDAQKSGNFVFRQDAG